uniref:Uncharacterized protein n=1 Tax=Corethron hystrix TaxID=216773 RepID=A0A7S1BWU0_9STRA
MKSHFELVASLLIFLWVADLTHFCYDQYRKIAAFSRQIDDGTSNDRSHMRSFLCLLLDQIFCAISLSLKVLSISFVVVVYRNLDDVDFFHILIEFSNSLAVTSHYWSILSAVVCTFYVVFVVYLHTCVGGSNRDNRREGSVVKFNDGVPYAAVAVAI